MASLKKQRLIRLAEVKMDSKTVQNHIDNSKNKSADYRLGLYQLRRILAITAAALEKRGL